MFEQISKFAEASIAEGSAVGASCLIFKEGKELYSGFFGSADREENKPMQRDSIFRLFSLTKPVTAAAAMILIDRGLLSPNDPVSKFFPEYSELLYENENGDILPCDNIMTIEHLLTMTSGLPYANNYNKSVCSSAELFDELISRQNTNNPMSTEEFTEKASKVILSFKPGEKWDYGISADIIGGIIERASGMRYSDFLKENIFIPLGMNDTDFYVPEEKRHRFTALYSYKDRKLLRDYGCYLGLTNYTAPPAFESGGAGLCSTIDDYSKFACMLAGKGELNGVRIISESSFEYMISPKLGRTAQSFLWDRLKGYNYGCLVRVMTEPEISEIKTGKGEFGWDGWTGTYFCADANTGIVVLYFTQICGAGTTWQAAQASRIAYEELLQSAH